MLLTEACYCSWLYGIVSNFKCCFWYVHFWSFQAFSWQILLEAILSKDPDLPEDFFRKWEDSQVFIYYKRGITKKFLSEFPYPDCFGNLITADYVITATSCFIDLKKLVKRLRDREIDGFYSPQGKPLKVMKSDISKITIAKVYAL